MNEFIEKNLVGNFEFIQLHGYHLILSLMTLRLSWPIFQKGILSKA